MQATIDKVRGQLRSPRDCTKPGVKRAVARFNITPAIRRSGLSPYAPNCALCLAPPASFVSVRTCASHSSAGVRKSPRPPYAKRRGPAWGRYRFAPAAPAGGSLLKPTPGLSRASRARSPEDAHLSHRSRKRSPVERSRKRSPLAASPLTMVWVRRSVSRRYASTTQDRHLLANSPYPPKTPFLAAKAGCRPN